MRQFPEALSKETRSSRKGAPRHLLALACLSLVFLTALVTASQASAIVTFTGKWGSQGSGDGQFVNPKSIAVDAAGNVYVGDAGNHRIQKFTSEGAFLGQWGTEGSGDRQFLSLEGIATDAVGNVYVGDSENDRVQKFTSGGSFLTQWGTEGSGDGEFIAPRGIAIDGTGNVYVVDDPNARVQKFTSEGVFLGKWGSPSPVGGGGDGGQFWGPTGIAIDGIGNVYVADYFNYRIQKFTSEGVFLTKWGSQGGDDGQFIGPDGIATDAAGNVYVGDDGRIQKFTSEGLFLEKWGSGGSGDGQFKFGPNSIATDTTGNIYVVDTGNHRIQKFSPGAPEEGEGGEEESPPTSPDTPVSPTSPATLGPAPPPTTTAQALAPATAQVQGGKALLPLRCPGPSPCAGSLQLITEVNSGRRSSAQTSRAPKRSQGIVIGKARYGIPAGKRKTIRVPLTRRGKQLLRQRGSRGLRVQVRGRGLKSRTVILKPKRR